MAVSSNPFSSWNGEDLWRYWLPQAANGGGGSFVQPILPWTLNINNINSRAPATEAAVVAKHSYGRQIGRIADLLHLLLTTRHGDLLDDEAAAEFMAMWREVEAIKAAGAGERVRQLAKDLASIKAENPEEYMQLRNLLKSRL